jgi:PKD repeat protein
VCSGLALWSACDSAIPTAPSGTVLTISANPSQISLTGTSQIIVIGRRPDGNPLNEGTEIFFTTDLGAMNPAFSTVDEDGVARATLRGDGRVGTAMVQARVGTATTGEGATGSATVTVQIGRNAGSLSVQATPSSIPETGGSVNLLALVRDDQGQPLASVAVNFMTDVGTLESGGAFVQTNSRGEARDTLTVTEADVNSVGGDSFQVGAEAAAGGAVLQDEAPLSILRRPRASFTSTRNQLSVSFTDTSTGNPTSWLWDFGDDSPPSTLQNPAHQYEVADSYTVTLRVRNSLGEDTTSQIITVTSQ